jgi:drug/metabolite transporter (DMT)-like permease
MERDRLLGYGFGVLTALSWGTSPIFIRKGLEGLPSSLWGVAAGLIAATGVYLSWLFARILARRFARRLAGGPPAGESPQRVWKLDRMVRAALLVQALAGVAAGLGTVGRTLSIELAPIVVAIPLAQTSSLFTLIFAPLFLGARVERVNARLVAGVMLVLFGSALVVIGRNR